MVIHARWSEEAQAFVDPDGEILGDTEIAEAFDQLNIVGVPVWVTAHPFDVFLLKTITEQEVVLEDDEGDELSFTREEFLAQCQLDL